MYIVCVFCVVTSVSSFQVSGPSTSIAGVSADDCSQDYVVIQSAASTLTANSRTDRSHCGHTAHSQDHSRKNKTSV